MRTTHATRVAIRTILTTLVTATLGLAMPVMSTAAADTGSATSSSTGTPADLAAAQTSAVASSSPVVVADRTTPTDEVTALPDGSFSLQTTERPVRVKTSTGWTPVDTTLHQQADGTIAPDAIDADLAFSGGGSGPAILLGNSSHQLKLSLPASLPTPALDGPTATYPDVYPGIDLDVTANATGYSEVLVVKSAAAAANPVLRDLNIATSATGMDLTRASDGSLTANSGDPASSYTTDTPVMWDSTNNPQIGPPPSATDPGSGHVTALTDSLTTTATAGTTTGDLSVSAPGTALTGTSVTYPLYIDPGFTAGTTQWLTVGTSGAHLYKSTTQKLMVGPCIYAGCTIGVARSFFTLNLATLSGGTGTAHISAASIAADEIWNAYSSPTPVDLLYTKPFTSSTTWPGPGIWSTPQSVPSDNGHDGGQGQGDIFFDNSNVLDIFQNAATNHYSTLTFGLKSPDESNSSYQWKQFDTNPKATIYFDFAPSVPNDLAITSNQVKCPGKAIYSRTSAPTFTAHSVDGNPAGHTYPVGITFHLDTKSGSTRTYDRQSANTVTANSAGNAAWSTTSSNSDKSTPLTEGTWSFMAKATSLSTNSTPQSSDWSSWYDFTYDPTAPATPTYTFNTDGTITISAPGAAGITWSNISGTVTAPTDTTCAYNTATSTGGLSPVSNGTVTLPGPPPTSTNITVKAFDDAHNLSSALDIPLLAPPPAIVR